ncbi:hypothetical protein JOB18_045416 [Solea senegalensis]|uniref:Chloride channel CLIC-like protein 1 n=2 Tax=Solea senegalensis TaxID=28829 RepID=A0AAV6SAS2_SOLSE|nr:hypothetical protein JOB18_045416 [Solea senegalensis]
MSWSMMMALPAEAGELSLVHFTWWQMGSVVLLCVLLSVAVTGQRMDDWVDPYDMLNYDSGTKTMKTSTEPAHYDKVTTKRRQYTQDDPSQAESTLCNSKVEDLNRQIEEQKKKIVLISQQPTCNPVFKRFLSRLLKDIQRVGLPSDSSDVLYDAKIRMSRQAMTEIQTFLEGEDNWETGALDDAISQILMDLKHHDYEAWKWHFEDTFGVEIDTLLRVMLCVLILMAIICTQLWSIVSWFVQFRRLFAICFIISLAWNWFYLYKIAFAEHQSNIVKLEGISAKCTGVKRIDWSDNLKEWLRSTLTLQDDPCKTYYEKIMINPILLVPPNKPLLMTITTLFTEPLKHIGQGISEFLRALLKDLPVTLQIPVLLTIMLSIVVLMYGSMQAVFQHGITAPLRRPRRDPPPPEVEPPQPQFQRIQGREHLEELDIQQRRPRQRANDGRLHRHQVLKQQPNRPREEQGQVFVETLLAADPSHSEDETDSEQWEGNPDLSADLDSNEQQPAAASASGVAAETAPEETISTRSDSSEPKAKPVKVSENRSQDEPSKDHSALKPQPAKRCPSPADVKDPENKTSSVSLPHVETVGVPVQESGSAPLD